MTEQILIKKRSHIKAKLTRFINFLSDCKHDEQKRQEAPSRLERIEPIWKDFDAVQTELEDLNEAELESGERDSFENKFHHSITKVRSIISILQTNIVTHEQQAQRFNQPINIIQPNKMRLPTIEIPKFNGRWEEWLPFRDTFTAMVHRNETLPPIDKLHYLRWALVGDAYKLIESLEVTNENYQVAWEIVNNRYKGDKTIIQNHVQALINFPCITKESHSSLRQLVDTTLQHIRTLKRLEQPTDSWDTIFIQLFIPKLDSNTRRKWESERADKEELPCMKDFIHFLETRCSFLEALTRSTAISLSKNVQSHSKQHATKAFNQIQAHLSTENMICPICQNTHKIFECLIFRNMSAQARQERVKSNKLCYNCLKPFHGKKCTYGSCKKCHKHHNTLLHIDKAASNDSSQSDSKDKEQHSLSSAVESKNANESYSGSLQGANTSLSCHTQGSFSHVMLSTAIIHMRDKSDNLHSCRVLLDSGSQPNFISRELCERLGLPQQRTDTIIDGVNSISSTSQNETTATIYSRFNKYQETLPFLIIDKVTNKIPAVAVDVDSFQIPSNIKLADPTFHLPGKIDLILGSEVFWRLLCIGQIQISKTKPTFQKTKLGWIVSGRANPNLRAKQPVQCHFNQQAKLHDQIERFWQLEELHTKSHLTAEEQKCEEHFLKTHSREKDGRFIVQVPLKENYTQLGESYDTARHRLFSIERKLHKQPELKQQYDTFIQEYIDLGHMKHTPIAKDKELESPGRNPTYYMPHHAVVKDNNDTTRLRVVFDASAKTSSGLSLNDVQMVGPTIQQDLFSIIMRFRQHVYAVSADISKMYRQIKICHEQHKLQRILWRFTPEQEIKQYELQTVTYGEACSAFLAIRSLHQTAKDSQQQYLKAAKIIMRDFYVDDLLTGDDNIEELLQLKADLITVLRSAKFELHKWKSNHPALVDIHQNNTSVQLDEGTRILGQLWDTQHDTFRYTVGMFKQTRKATKRQVLSCISQIFDPLGLLGPAIITAKMIMQQLWQTRLDWDESLPTQLHTRWSQWYDKISHLSHLKIQRRILCDDPIRTELHGFCDASEHAYGACIYIRSTDLTQNHHVKLLCAKTRVAPLKTLSMPRLELCGALLLSQLYQRVIESLNIDFDNAHFWCDSTITLSWIAGDSNKWSIFVANRTAEIQRLSVKGQWHHIRSELNPADVLSRGLNPDEVQFHKLWWKGPSFLQEDYNQILRDAPQLSAPEKLPEVRKRAIALVATSVEGANIINKFSSLTRLKRTIAYCLRFIHNSKQRVRKDSNIITGPLQVEEIEQSMSILLSIAQREEYAEEIHCLKQGRKLSSKNKLLSLHPFLDNRGLLRVGGRLQEAQLSYNQKHPIILPKGQHLTHLIIREEHLKNMHAGLQSLLAIIRTRYWPIAGKSIIKKTLHKCIVCCRARATPVEQLMGNLPASRVEPLPPFAKSGVDYAGPFNIKISRNKTSKAYLCVFVCFVTKAVHLEIVSDLSTSAFLNALKRFIARRGKCICIYSDNGTNFVGANNALKEMYLLIKNSNAKIHDYLTEQTIKWHFLPPQSPHMGGLWESAVKAVKNRLTKIVSSNPLTFEELTTVITQIEAILNSRPLTPMSTDPTDLNALTPGHFLIGRPLIAVSEPDTTDISVNRLNRYQLLEQMKQNFWKRWSIEYLTQLQQRTKWKEARDSIRENTMVVLRERSIPPMNWRLGRIVKVYPGKDGLSRVVDVRTSSGIYQRSLSKLCILPIEV